MLDNILIDEPMLAKMMLIDEHVFEFSGKIESEYFLEHYKGIYLVQKSGYKLNLMTRIDELAFNYGDKVSVTYWITDTPKTAEELLEMTVLYQSGYISVEMNADHYEYSEYTAGTDYGSGLEIGGHSLLNELLNNIDRYFYMMIEFGK